MLPAPCPISNRRSNYLVIINTNYVTPFGPTPRESVSRQWGNMFNKVPARLKPTSGVLKPLHLDATLQPRHHLHRQRPKESGGNKDKKNENKNDNKSKNKANTNRLERINVKRSKKPPACTSDNALLASQHEAGRELHHRDILNKRNSNKKEAVQHHLHEVSRPHQLKFVAFANLFTAQSTKKPVRSIHPYLEEGCRGFWP